MTDQARVPGSDDFYDAFLAPMESRILRAVWRIVRNPDLVQDAVQDALAAIWRCREKIRLHPNPQALMLKITTDVSCDVLRRSLRLQQRERPAEDGEAAAPFHAPPTMQIEVVMLISGGALRIGHTSSFLAESFALRQTASSVTGRLERARQMECSLQARGEQNRLVRYSISWGEGRDSRVEIEGPGCKEVRFAPAPSMQASVVNVPRPEGRTPGSRPRDRRLEPIHDFLSAPAVAGLITGQWRAAPLSGGSEKDRKSFIVTSPGSRILTLVVVDLHAHLPVSLALFPAGSGTQLLNSEPVLNAEFRWEIRPGTPRQP
ncbi:MAG: hypothetical protein LAP85_11530 [Acidobacteriia bacterium]|nr:hypothetical protein [Terriglobia bacterium]